ncbi:hypothetical protein ACSBR2_036602 [Camellia fascicularis]
MCPAYNLGLKLVKATLASLLHGFNWKLPDNMKPEDVDMEEDRFNKTMSSGKFENLKEKSINALLVVF